MKCSECGKRPTDEGVGRSDTRCRRLRGFAPEELAAKILFLLRQRWQPSYGAALVVRPDRPIRHTGKVTFIWPSPRAWAWLEAQGLHVPAEGTNGTNGWRHLSRRARQMESAADFSDFKVARLIPKRYSTRE